MMSKAFKTSFIKRIIALIFLFNVIFIVLFIGMTFYTTKNNIDSIDLSTLKNSSDASVMALENYLDSLQITADTISASKDITSFMAGDSSLAERASDELASAAAANDRVSAVWCISDTSETLLTAAGSAPIQLDGSNRWYSTVQNYGGSRIRLFTVSEMNSSPVEGSTAKFLAVVPVSNELGYIGCVGIEADLAPLTQAFAKNPSSAYYHTFILTESGDVICSSENSGSLAETISKSGRTVEELIAESDSGIGAYSEADSRFDFGTRVILAPTNYGWRCAVISDGNAASADFHRMYLQQIIILACLFVLELIATLNVIRHESKDIPEISSSIAEISAGNYNFRINTSSENEIGLIANSVDRLAQTLQDNNAVIEDYRNLDPTTGLQNRYRLYEYIEDLMITRDDSRPRFALLFIDIDNFKWITETLGHRQGDDFLKIFASRIKTAAPKSFRFSGDQFVSVIEVNDDFSVIDDTVDNMRREFQQPIRILNDSMYVQFSVGVSVYPDDDTNPDMLLRDADIAMARAKEKGKGRMAYYKAALHKTIKDKTIISQRLNSALKNNEMFLNFQPIVTVENGDIHGFEVLVRWESEDLGYVPPFEFVQIAEETGAIVEIGTWIFENACRYLKQMNEYNKDIIMSINVSAIQLKKPDFLDKVKRTISIIGVDPKNIQVELTETCLVDLLDGNNNSFIQEMADMGISLALDDFGTGYSSFGYLKSMPIKTLKVDKSFVDEICSKRKDLQITESIIDMVKNLGIKTVVEGVESIEQYNILSEMGCDYIQGFLMSKPLNADDAMEFVVRYDELHKPNKRSLEENSNKLAAEKAERQKAAQ